MVYDHAQSFEPTAWQAIAAEQRELHMVFYMGELLFRRGALGVILLA